MFQKLLILCTGNICRSPLAAARLQQALDAAGRDVEIRSAGLGALPGYPADPKARTVAEARGLDVSKHVARQLDADLVDWAELILVMDRDQRRFLIEQAPFIAGKVRLFGHWVGEEVPDPYLEELAIFEDTMDLIDQAAEEWAKRL